MLKHQYFFYSDVSIPLSKIRFNSWLL